MRLPNLPGSEIGWRRAPGDAAAPRMHRLVLGLATRLRPKSKCSRVHPSGKAPKVNCTDFGISAREEELVCLKPRSGPLTVRQNARWRREVEKMVAMP